MINKWGYKPELDGLRVIAIYLVVLFHANISFFENGYIGVDLFFVLSGFLVCNVLITETEQHGTIRFSRFYARRFRRLLPASLSMIVIVSFLSKIILSPIVYQDIYRDGYASLLYFANFHFIAEATDYFNAENADSPFLHFWSLSIEEQYYFFFPILLLGSIKIKQKFGDKLPLFILGVVALLSIYLQLSEPNEVVAYFSTQTRVYQMLAGALLAYFLREKVSNIRKVNTFVTLSVLSGFVFLSTSIINIPTSHRGIYAAIISISIIYALQSNKPTFLTHPKSVYLGKISYGTYLWHWPIIVFAKHFGVTNMWVLLVLSALGGTGMAVLSYHTVEAIFREKVNLSSYKVFIYTSLMVSIITGLGLSYLANNLDNNEWIQLANEKNVFPNCTVEDLQQCIVVEGEGQKIHIVGDSHAAALLPAFVKISEEEGYQLSATVLASCRWQYGTHSIVEPRLEIYREQCEEQRAKDYAQTIPAISPDMVILASMAYDDISLSEEVKGNLTSTEIGLIEDDSLTVVRNLTEKGINVIIIEPTPIYPSNESPLICLSKNKDCSFSYRESLQSEMFSENLAAENPMMESVDIDSLFCNNGTCRTEIEGIPVFQDRHHLSKRFVKANAANLRELILVPVLSNNN